MSREKVLLVLTGEAFRHVNGRDYVDPEVFNDQKICTYSQLRFLNAIKPIEADIFINTYARNPEYDAALRSWYPNIVRYTVHPDLMGEYPLIDNTIAQLKEMNLSLYDGILFVRIDFFLREYFTLTFIDRPNAITYAHLDSHIASSNNPAGYPGVCHNIVYVPRTFFPLLLQGLVWKRHESAELASKHTTGIRFFSNTFHSCNTGDEWNPLYAMAGRDEPQVLWCGLHGNWRGKRFNWVTLEINTINNDTGFDYMLGRDCRLTWKHNPEGLLVPKKRVLIYANCQGRAIRNILAYHPDFAKEYNIFGAEVIENYSYMNTNRGLPYDLLGEADLFIYQPISRDRGDYSTEELLATLKPGVKVVSFPYLYNYALWEILAMSDADYDVGIFGMKYAHLNEKPITELRDAGVPFQEVERRIRAKEIDWRFEERYTKTQAILREKEKDCDVKVADFIDQHLRDHVLFFTQNHPSIFFLRYVSQQILAKLGFSTELPDEDHLLHPDYNSGRTKRMAYEVGEAAWKYFGFRFMSKPAADSTQKIIDMAKKVYETPPRDASRS